MAALKVVLLHHKGAKSGVERVNPVAYREVGDNIAVFASNAGRKANPDWYYNLVAHPETVVELGTERFPVRARVARGGERTEIWEAQKVDAPMLPTTRRRHRAISQWSYSSAPEPGHPAHPPGVARDCSSRHLVTCLACRYAP